MMISKSGENLDERNMRTMINAFASALGAAYL